MPQKQLFSEKKVITGHDLATVCERYHSTMYMSRQKTVVGADDQTVNTSDVLTATTRNPVPFARVNVLIYRTSMHLPASEPAMCETVLILKTNSQVATATSLPNNFTVFYALLFYAIRYVQNTPQSIILQAMHNLARYTNFLHSMIQCVAFYVRYEYLM